MSAARRICASGNGKKPSDTEINEILTAASNGDIISLAELSITKGVDVTAARNRNGVTTLHEAARSGNRKLVTMLIVPCKTSIDRKDKYGSTPLHVAARNGYKRVVKELVKAGATKDARDNFGVTPLHVAAKNGHKKVIKVLVRANALVDTMDVYGWTPLASAVVNDYSGIIKYLVKDARADCSKVKYQFQHRIRVLLGEVETRQQQQQNNGMSPTAQAPHQEVPRREIIHHRSSSNACPKLSVATVTIFGVFCTYILPGGFSAFIHGLLAINF